MQLPSPYRDGALGFLAQTPDFSGLPGVQDSPSPAPCVPMRRRSLIQIPGIATRVTKDYPPLPAKPVIQINHGLLASCSGSDSSVFSDDVGSGTSRGPELQERSATQCDTEYRQLGGIKFGSLRITNGSPNQNSAAEDKAWTQPTPLPVTSPTQGSPVIEKPVPGMVVTTRDARPERELNLPQSQRSPSYLRPDFSSQNMPRKHANAWVPDQDLEQVPGSTPLSLKEPPRTPNRQTGLRPLDTT